MKYLYGVLAGCSVLSMALYSSSNATPCHYPTRAGTDTCDLSDLVLCVTAGVSSEEHSYRTRRAVAGVVRQLFATWPEHGSILGALGLPALLGEADGEGAGAGPGGQGVQGAGELGPVGMVETAMLAYGEVIQVG